MPTFWECCSEPSKKLIRRFMGKRWRDPDAKPTLDELPASETVREMERRPTGNAALLGGGHGV